MSGVNQWTRKEADSRRYRPDHGCANQSHQQAGCGTSNSDPEFGEEIARLIRIRFRIHERNAPNREQDDLTRLQSCMGRDQRMNELMPKNRAKNNEKENQSPLSAGARLVRL